jgi:tellurite resistance protein TerC
VTAWLWIGFVAFVLLMLALDLCVVNRRPHEVRAREALAWTTVCIALALAFNTLVYFMYEHHWLGVGLREPGRGTPLDGRAAALQFLTGWLVEYSLSVDNIFVMAVIFSFFKVPNRHQHRILFWGVLGALIMRGMMIGCGTALISHFRWTTYVFAAFLLYTAARLLTMRDHDPDPEKGLVLRFARRFLRVGPAHARGDGPARFFTRVNGRWAVTPLFLVLLVIETTDVVFAVDSIPAIIGITHDPFLVFTSNIFAILGLRSLYFALLAVLDRFRYLKLSLVFVLAFVGVKMLLDDTRFEVPTEWSLGAIGLILALGAAASLLLGKRIAPPPDPPAT